MRVRASAQQSQGRSSLPLKITQSSLFHGVSPTVQRAPSCRQPLKKVPVNPVPVYTGSDQCIYDDDTSRVLNSLKA